MRGNSKEDSDEGRRGGKKEKGRKHIRFISFISKSLFKK